MCQGISQNIFNYNSVNSVPLTTKDIGHERPATGRGARVSACAGLINQLQRCRFDSRIACLKNPDTVIVSEWWTGGEGTPRSVPRSKKWEGKPTAETNASTLMRLTSHVTISPKIHCKQTKM